MTGRAFIAMPFDAAFNDVYTAIKDAVAAVDRAVVATRLDEVRAAGHITNDMVEALRTCTLCVADVTGANPNVMWEVGFAAALQKPTLVLQEGAGRPPFDVSHLRTLRYDRADLAGTLRAPLAVAVRETLERYTVLRPPVPAPQLRAGLRAIAVTGTMATAVEPVRVRLAQVLGPYLGRGHQWYVGGRGTTDEVALQLLVEAGEDAAVVGYNAYDLSGAQLAMLERHPQLSFVDATLSQLPRATDAPSERDVLFAARADLVVVIWDGASRGAGDLLRWLDRQGKDHVVGFVPVTR